MNKEYDVCVLMSTYNGETYVREQIESIIHQKNINVFLLVRDDLSSDGTVEILSEYEKKGLLRFYVAENNVGPAKSFLELLRNAPKSSYYAFADQDDVWLEDKLLDGITQLQQFNNVPAYFCSCVEVVDKNLNDLGKVYGESSVYNFATQIARSNVIGCSMILNDELVELVNKHQPNNICMHDQWISILCKGVGGVEVRGREKKSLYRQHNNNAVGAKLDLISKFDKSSLKKNSARLYQVKELKDAYYKELLPENQEIVDLVISYQDNLKSRLKLLFIKTNAEKWWMNLAIKLSFFRGSF